MGKEWVLGGCGHGEMLAARVGMAGRGVVGCAL